MKKLENFTYFDEKKKKKTLKVKVCKSIWSKISGLMFRKKSPPLLFFFRKEKTLSIHSFFCKPFRAIWLDDKKKITRNIEIKKWGANFSGKGKYLIEIPFPTTKAPTKK
jgi:uncharacterized membrane protein (UPF0127 family)